MTKFSWNFNIAFSALFIILLFSYSAPAVICPLGDLDGNCKVDLVDVQMLVDRWLDPACAAPDCGADIVPGLGVNLLDYVQLANNNDKTGVHVVISEFMAKNDGCFITYIDGEKMEELDWIELYNPSDTVVDLGGCYLTDRPGNKTKWPFPPGTILRGNSYLVVFASDKTQEENPNNYPFVDDLGYLHTNFKLDKDGDYLALVLPNGQTVESQHPGTHPEPYEYSQQYMNWSYGFSQNLMSEGYFYPATPGKPNGAEPVADPTKNIFISEIMYHPFHDEENIQPEPRDLEFIELYNRGIDTVDLTGWSFADGVDFTFPSKLLDPNQYLVVAANVDAFLSANPGVDPNLVVGGWQGRLSNSGEDIDLVDENGLRMDRVDYADRGDWSARYLDPMEDRGHRGWIWKEDHDGGGKSLELINPFISNNYGQNWAASGLTGGTPGWQNSVYAENIPPMILEVEHSPILPKDYEPVTITAQIRDEQTSGLNVKLHYRVDESTYNQNTYPVYEPSEYTVVDMYDDGQHGDRRAGNGTYGAILPAQTEGTVMEFFVEAGDGFLTRTWPPPSDVDGTPQQVTNCLYQVFLPDDMYDPNQTWTPGSQPVYYFVMTEMERGRLEDIGDLHDEEARSHAQMNATFISRDGVDTKRRYTVGLRNRGKGSRGPKPNNYRVNFRHDQPWKGVTAINVNSKYTYLQLLGNVIFPMSGLPALDAKAVQIRVNGENLALLGPDKMCGSYVHLEVYDVEWAENHIPEDAEGNLYRCLSDGKSADLTYRDADPYNYRYDGMDRDRYTKATNTAENDWSDLIHLTDVLDNARGSGNYVEQVEQTLNADWWLRWLAVQTILSNQETNLSNGAGDDYYLYSGLEDPRFLLLPYDLDDTFGLGQHSVGTSRSIWLDGKEDSLPVVRDFLKHPAFAGSYYGHLKDVIETTFSSEQLHPLIEDVLGDFPDPFIEVKIQAIKDFASGRNSYVLSQIPSADFTLSSDLSEDPPGSGYYKTTSSTATGANINGVADVIETRSVLINGIEADWDHLNGDWSVGSSIPLNPGIYRVFVQTFDDLEGGGNELERKYIDIWYDDSTISSVPNPLTQTHTVLDASSGPWYLAGNLTVPSGYTLTIESGATVYFNQGVRLTVQGRLLAQGTEYQRIRLTLDPDSGDSAWGGIRFNGSAQDNRLCYVDMDFASSANESVRLDSSKVLLDNVTWKQTNTRSLQIEQSSAIVRNCVFPENTSRQTVVGHRLLSSDPYLLFENNVFGFNSSPNKDDVVDITTTGSSVKARFINNVFYGGGDDALDLDGTKGYVDGNLFMHFHRDFPPSEGEAYGVSTGYDAGHSSSHVIVRNIFIDCDHAALVKAQSWIRFENNVLIDCGVGINFDEPSEAGIDPGVGAYLAGNIFRNVTTPLAQYYVNDPTWGTTDITVNRCIIPSSWHSYGEGNIDANPHFVDEQDDFHLRWYSPAIGTGPNGLDMGAYVPAGASLTLSTLANSATITVGGPGITDYMYSLDDPNGPWSAETPVSQPIQLTGLVNGQTYTLYAFGKNSADLWQDPNEAASVTWTVSNNGVPLVINEILAINDAAVEHNGLFPDMIELYYDGAATIFLDNMSITDEPDDPLKYIIPASTMLDSTNRYLVLYADPNTAQPYHTGFALDGDGEAVYLYDSTGHLLDSVQFGSQIPDLSLGRVNQGPWRLTVPTLGQANVVQDLAAPDTLRINEFLASGKVLFVDDFIELYNPELLPVDLSELYLTDNPIMQPGKHKLGPLSFAAAQGYVEFDADDSRNPRHVDFQLSVDQEEIALYDAQLQAIDKLIYGPQTTDVSRGRLPDGQNTWAYFDLPTPGLANLDSGPDYDRAIKLLTGLRITEIMYHPQNAPASHPDAEFIELLNVGPDELNLDGVRFTNGIDYIFPAMTLGSGDYIVIVKDPAIFQNQYGVIPEVIGEYDGSLSNGGENIVLKLPAPFDAAIMRFEYNDAWYPATDGGGYALVVADPYAQAALWLDRDGWQSGSVLGGSPGTDDP